MNSNRPAHEIRSGALKATIWEARNERGAFYTVKFERLYKSGESWRQSQSFSGQNLTALAELLAQAKTWVTQHKAGN